MKSPLTFAFLLIIVVFSCQAFRLKFLQHNKKSLALHDKTPSDVAISNAKTGKSWFKCRPLSVGAVGGATSIPNKDFESLVETNHDWIFKRTGISNRHVLSASSRLREVAASSALQALESSNISPSDLDLVIVATSSRDDLFGDAASVAASIGATGAAAFDLTAACSGFVFGLVTGAQFIETGAYKKVLVIGADALSRFLDWKDRGSCILFGDGAGAMVLEATEEKSDSGLLGFALHSDGKRYPAITLKFESNFTELPNEAKNIVDTGNYGKLGMVGPDVFKFAVNAVPEVINEALANAGMKASDVDWLLLHQANTRIMDHAASTLRIPAERVLKNIGEYGNTSAGSIPLALAEAVRAGKIKKGDIIAVCGFGAGLSWGAAIIKWQ